MDTDVLIIGAGPTGLMLANQLARRGVRVTIVDRLAAPARETRALAVQARTLEIYARLGVVERALELGHRATGANVWARGRRGARIPLGDIGRELSPYPFVLILGQDDNELILREKLLEHGVEVRRGLELVGLAQTEDRVTARLKRSDGTLEELTASWLAGCDGAKSAVRESCGIAFEGAPYDHVFFVADTRATGAMVPGELNVYLRPKAFHLFFPMRGSDHWRIVGILPERLQNRDDLTFDEVFPAVHGEVGPELKLHSCTWFSTYRIHHRRAARFRDRRTFLLGDAAHIHSPVGGQGMNTGLQDAYNLAWKLALVVSGRAREELLDTYGEEREPIATRLLRTTDQAFSLIVADNWIAGLIRTRLMARILSLAMRSERFQKLAFLTVSQTGIRYRGSSLSQSSGNLPANALRPGDRFPCLRLKLEPNGPVEDLFSRVDDTRFNLILIGQAAPSSKSFGFDDLLRIHEVPCDSANERVLEDARIPRPSFYLLRPDGHIGLAGSQAQGGEIRRYAADCLGLRLDTH